MRNAESALDSAIYRISHENPNKNAESALDSAPKPKQFRRISHENSNKFAESTLDSANRTKKNYAKSADSALIS
ncbi:hypothetical protein [Helicobacter sp. 23-1045]